MWHCGGVGVGCGGGCGCDVGDLVFVLLLLHTECQTRQVIRCLILILATYFLCMHDVL